MLPKQRCWKAEPKSSFGEHEVYTSQTKILEDGTKDEVRVFEVLFEAVST